MRLIGKPMNDENFYRHTPHLPAAELSVVVRAWAMSKNIRVEFTVFSDNAEFEDALEQALDAGK